MGSRGRPSPITSQSGADVLAEELADCRLQLLAMARPPINPTVLKKEPCLPRWSECLWKTPLTSSFCGPCTAVSCARHFGQCPTHAPLRRLIQVTGCRFDGPRRPTQAPHQRRGKNAHRGSPGGHVPLSSKGVHPCCRTWKALSLPGEHASRILPNRMRPVIFHAFGKAKKDASKVLDELAQLGWKALPIALLGMPHYLAAWVCVHVKIVKSSVQRTYSVWLT